jgi:hypothetical protein
VAAGREGSEYDERRQAESECARVRVTAVAGGSGKKKNNNNTSMKERGTEKNLVICF